MSVHPPLAMMSYVLVTGSEGTRGRADQLGTGRMLVMTQSLAWPVVTGRVPETIATLALTGAVGSVTWNVSGPVWRMAGWLLNVWAQAPTTNAGVSSHGW
jgi:hypothetical protein